MSSRPSPRVEGSVVEYDRHAKSSTVVGPAQSQVQIPPLEDSVGMTVGVVDRALRCFRDGPARIDIKRTWSQAGFLGTPSHFFLRHLPPNH